MSSVWLLLAYIVVVCPKIISTDYFSGMTQKTEWNSSASGCLVSMLIQNWVSSKDLIAQTLTYFFVHHISCVHCFVYECVGLGLPHWTRLNDPHLSLAPRVRISLWKPISTYPRDTSTLLYIKCRWKYQRSKLIIEERKDDRGSEAGCPSPEATVSSPGGQTAAGVNLQFGALACVQATVRGSCVQKVLTEV